MNSTKIISLINSYLNPLTLNFILLFTGLLLGLIIGLVSASQSRKLKIINVGLQEEKERTEQRQIDSDLVKIKLKLNDASNEYQHQLELANIKKEKAETEHKQKLEIILKEKTLEKEKAEIEHQRKLELVSQISPFIEELKSLLEKASKEQVQDELDKKRQEFRESLVQLIIDKLDGDFSNVDEDELQNISSLVNAKFPPTKSLLEFPPVLIRLLSEFYQT